jgi:hypothetical protein
MHPHDEDSQLRGLLREWKAPEAPSSLERRVLGGLEELRRPAPESRRQPAREPRRQPWWRFVFSGYIRVPVPVACGLVVLLTFAAWRVADQPPVPCVSERAAASVPSNHCEHPAPGVC